jgi:glutaminase
MNKAVGAQPVVGAEDTAVLAPVEDYLAELHSRVSALTGGKPADYIPELGKANPAHFGIAIATIDGEVYAVGDVDQAFTIQSVSKPFMYGYALNRYGRDAVLKHVGVEPTGEAFNSIVLDEVANRPFNPMVNAGAIAVAELMDGALPEERIANMLALFGGLAGRQVEIDEAVFLSEQATGHRNRAIAYMMLNTGMINHDPNEVLDLYFRQCSVNVTTRDLAVMAATLANDGTNPVTGKRVFEAQYVRDVLSVMNSCGACTTMPESGPTRSACRPKVASRAASSPSFRGRSASACSRLPSTRTATACAGFASARKSRRSSSCTPSTIAPMSEA